MAIAALIPILVQALPTIATALAGVATDFNLLDDDDAKKADRIIGRARDALAYVPDAIDDFIALKIVIGGEKPTRDQLLALADSIEARSGRIQDAAAAKEAAAGQDGDGGE